MLKDSDLKDAGIIGGGTTITMKDMIDTKNHCDEVGKVFARDAATESPMEKIGLGVDLPEPIVLFKNVDEALTEIVPILEAAIEAQPDPYSKAAISQKLETLAEAMEALKTEIFKRCNV